jgi:hypothetical protein
MGRRCATLCALPERPASNDPHRALPAAPPPPSSQLFSLFRLPSGGCATLGLGFNTLADMLAVFAAAPDCELELRHPGPDGELLFECARARPCRPLAISRARRALLAGLEERLPTPALAPHTRGLTPATPSRRLTMHRHTNTPTAVRRQAQRGMHAYGRLQTLQAPPPADLGDYWQEPASYVIAPPALLREVVEDLEWPGGAVQLRMQRDPQRLLLSAAGTGSLEVEVQAAELIAFACAGQEVVAQYKCVAMGGGRRRRPPQPPLPPPACARENAAVIAPPPPAGPLTHGHASNPPHFNARLQADTARCGRRLRRWRALRVMRRTCPPKSASTPTACSK